MKLKEAKGRKERRDRIGRPVFINIHHPRIPGPTPCALRGLEKERQLPCLFSEYSTFLILRLAMRVKLSLHAHSSRTSPDAG